MRFVDEQDDDWLEPAVAAVERSICELVEGFTDDPYRHRVEHCLHTELVSLLRAQPALHGLFPLADGRRRTQLVHKEWPETRPPPGKKGRGSFDIAVLGPGQLARTTIDQFLAGRVAAPIVIELGLNYDLRHLAQDESKLFYSQVRHPYLVHFCHRTPARAADVEAFLTAPVQVFPTSYPVRTAYAHANPVNDDLVRKHLEEDRPRTMATTRP